LPTLSSSFDTSMIGHFLGNAVLTFAGDGEISGLGNIILIGALLILLVVGFIALVYAIDKTLKRRRARRA